MNKAPTPGLVEPARRGRPRSSARRASSGEMVRVELRLPNDVAARLFHLANETGHSVSSVGAEALSAGLSGGAAV